MVRSRLGKLLADVVIEALGISAGVYLSCLTGFDFSSSVFLHLA